MFSVKIHGTIHFVPDKSKETKCGIPTIGGKRLPENFTTRVEKLCSACYGKVI